MKSKRKRSPKFKKKVFFLILSFTILLITARILLPYIVLKYVNKSLSEMKGYNGHVEDIDIRLIRGAYVINNINIYETDTILKITDTIPFFSAEKIDLAIDWKSILHKRIVGVIAMNNPVLNFKNKKIVSAEIKSDTADFRQLIRELLPLTINSLKIVDGEIHYIDIYSSPPFDIQMNNIICTATNLSNVILKDSLLPSKVLATGNSYGGTFKLNVNLDLLSKIPTFDLNAELNNLDLARINDFLKAYGKFDVKSGKFSVYTEFAAKNGKFTGYVKPLLSNHDVVQWNKEEGNVPQIIWETVIASVATILTNQKKDQFATKLNIDGDFVNTQINYLTAIKYVLINAYIEALNPYLDNSININSEIIENNSKNFFEKLFSKKDKN
jgi:hypothetical protein